MTFVQMCGCTGKLITLGCQGSSNFAKSKNQELMISKLLLGEKCSDFKYDYH